MLTKIFNNWHVLVKPISDDNLNELIQSELNCIFHFKKTNIILKIMATNFLSLMILLLEYTVLSNIPITDSYIIVAR